MAEDVSYVSVCHLTTDALNILNRLNTRRLIPSDGPNKLPRDWRGVANLAGITTKDTESHHQNMLKWILQSWIQNNESSATVHQLFRHLETIDRYDIRDDLQGLVDSKRLVNRDHRWTVETQAVAQRLESNEELLTIHDIEEGAPVEYDALVLFAEADQEFVDIMIKNMTAIGFRLFTKYSLRPGIMPYRPMTELISSRCRHTILVYSPAFFESLDDKFYTDYVHARNIETRNHMLIPCVYKECELPKQYKYYFSLYVHTTAYNFWDRLARVVDAGRTPRLTTPNPSSSLRIQEVSGSRSQLRITNGHVSNGQVVNGQIANGRVSQASNAYVTSPTTETIALPDVPTTLSLSVTTLNSLESRRIDTASLNDLSAKKKKSKGFSFLKKPFRWVKKNKTKEVFLASK